MRMFTAALLALVLASTASAKGSESETCLRNKVWAGYADGWGIRTMTTTGINVGTTKNYLVTLYRGNEYRILTCGEEKIGNLDVLIYDAKGNLIRRDATTDREPAVLFEPENTGSYYLVLYLREMKTRERSSEVSMAIVYK